jgi:glycosyltransferase involved in cell wall biosynthesis
MATTAGRGLLDGFAVCTIVSKNYMAQARALAESLAQTNPGVPMFVLLVDRVDGHFDPQAERFTLLELERLPINDLPRFCFQYSVLELSTAAKPFLLDYLFKQFGLRKVVYLDPDILVFASLQPLAELLDVHSVVLTPHMTEPTPDERKPNETDMLRAGAYNLGFCALANNSETAKLLDWWKARLYQQCLIDMDRGLFVDQKWLDLAPGYFDGVFILRDPGYNIAYWNLHNRQVIVRDGKPTVNGAPVVLFHFSGFNPLEPDLVSRHQDRYTMADLGELRKLFELYGERLMAHGYAQCRDWTYAYGSFDNGTRIPEFVRAIYRRLGDKAAIFGNPFRTDVAVQKGSPGSFFRWLNAPMSNGLTPLLAELHLIPGMRHLFPEVGNAYYHNFLRWVLKEGRVRLKLDEAFLEPARLLLDSILRPGAVPAVPLRQRPEARPFGVNLAGYLQSEKGVGEAARAVARALQAANIPHTLHNIVDCGSANKDQSFCRFSGDNPYLFNMILVNADQVPEFASARPHFMPGHYNIGYWNWELSTFLDEWTPLFAYFDEVWAPSTFTLASLAPVATVPVRLMPFAVSVPTAITPGLDRRRFDLPEDAFLFLFSFDFHSFFERKNPLAVVEAFRRAFGERGDVALVVKTVHAASVPDALANLKAACGGQTNIRLIDDVLDRSEMHALMLLCDAYVALHRSEGYGLPLCEAMAMGKPVIATAYSANIDFMNAQNSLPVRCRLVEITEEHGPYYRPGAVWADPDVEQAADHMRRLVRDRSLARSLGDRARRDIARVLSPERVGELMYTRLLALADQVLPTGRDFTPVARHEPLGQLHLLYNVSRVPYDSRRRFIGPVLTTLKGMVLRLLRRILRQQTAYNSVVNGVITDLTQRLDRQQREIAELTARLYQQRFLREDEPVANQPASRLAA